MFGMQGLKPDSNGFINLKRLCVDSSCKMRYSSLCISTAIQSISGIAVRSDTFLFLMVTFDFGSQSLQKQSPDVEHKKHHQITKWDIHELILF